MIIVMAILGLFGITPLPGKCPPGFFVSNAKPNGAYTCEHIEFEPSQAEFTPVRLKLEVSMEIECPKGRQPVVLHDASGVRCRQVYLDKEGLTRIAGE